MGRQTVPGKAQQCLSPPDRLPDDIVANFRIGWGAEREDGGSGTLSGYQAGHNQKECCGRKSPERDGT